MLSEMRWALIIAKLAGSRNDAMMIRDVLHDATLGGARSVDRACASFEPLAALRQVASAGAIARVPMPVVLSVPAQPHILGKAIQAVLALAMRLIAMNRLCNLFQRIEALGL